jgi:hypothetical protein
MPEDPTTQIPDQSQDAPTDQSADEAADLGAEGTTDEPRMVVLAERLLARTLAGQQAWIQQSNSPAAFQTTVGDQVVTVASVDEDGNHPFTLSLWRRKRVTEAPGEEPPQFERVETLKTGPRSLFSFQAVASGPSKATESWANLVAQVWREARGNALHIGESIDAALDALKD